LPEPLLAIFKVCALALIYLFFFRVLRAVWAEVRTVKAVPAPAGAPAARKEPARPARRLRRSADRLVVLEPAEQKGRSFELGEEATLGRAAGCQVTVDDHYASQLHARVFRQDDQVFVEDLGSTNGTYLNTRRITSPVALKRGDKLKIGSTVMEVGG
jgi:hypothetical protein